MMIQQNTAFMFLFTSAMFNRIAEAKSTREIIQEKRVYDCTLESKKLEDCDKWAYFIRLGVESAPGIIIAVGIILVWSLYLIFKYRCNCCGGRDQSLGFCCPAPPGESQVIYKKSDIIRVKVFVACCVFAATLSSIWGVIGVTGVIRGLNSMSNEKEKAYEKVKDEVSQLRKGIVLDTYDAISDTWGQMTILDQTVGDKVYKAAIDAFSDVDSRIREYTDDVAHYMRSYAIGIIFIYIIPLCVMCIGLAFALCNVRGYMPMILMNICVLISTVVWTIHSPLTASSMIFRDLCTEIDSASQNQLNVISSVFECDNNKFGQFRGNLSNMESKGVYATCGYLAKLCYVQTDNVIKNIKYKQVLACPTNIVALCPSISFAEIIQMTETYFIHTEIYTNHKAEVNGMTCSSADWQQQCTLARCSTDCKYTDGSLSPLGRLSKQLVSSLNNVKVFEKNNDMYVSRYSFCDSVINFIISYNNSGCQSISSGLAKGRQAVGVIGIAFVACAVILVMGSKRFMSLKELINGSPDKRYSRKF